MFYLSIQLSSRFIDNTECIYHTKAIQIAPPRLPTLNSIQTLQKRVLERCCCFEQSMKLHGKWLTERCLFFQPWRIHFVCVFSRVCVWVIFLDSVKSCGKLPFLFSISCRAQHQEVLVLKKVKSVASRAYWKALEEVKSVASRACWKALEEVKSVASRACWKQCEQDFFTHPTSPHLTPPQPTPHQLHQLQVYMTIHHDNMNTHTHIQEYKQTNNQTIS